MTPLSLRWLTENWRLKIISLILAVGFWFYVVGEESIEITKSVPLEIKPPSDKLSVVKSSASNLEVTFQSPRHLFSALSSGNVTARHRVENLSKPGAYSFNIGFNDFLLPAPEIRIMKIVPSFVTVTLDEVIVKKLPVKADLVGEAAYGYRVDLEAIELDPNAVLVEGPKAVLEQMDSVKTEPIQLVGRVRSFRRTVRIHQPADIRLLGDGITDVQIPIKAEYAERELADILVKPFGLPAADHYLRLDSDRVSVTLKGPAALLEKLSAGDLLAYVPVDGLKEGLHELAVKFILPQDLALKNDPPVVSVQIRKLK